MNFPRTLGVSILLLVPHLAFAQEPHVLKHDGWVAAVAFAPDGKTLASAGADNVVRLWEVGTWKQKGVLKGHSDCVCAVSFGPEGSASLATGSYDRTARWWSLNQLTATQVMKDFGGAVTAVSATQGVLITGSVDGKVRFDNQIVAGLTHQSWVNSVAVGKAGIASGSSDATVRLVAGGKTHVLEGGAGEVRCVAVSPDGKLLAAGNRYHTVRVWDVASRKEITTLTGHMSDVWSIAFSPDGKTLATVDTDWKKPSKIRLYDTTTWKERGSLAMPGEILCLAYSPKGDWLAAGSWDKTVRLFPIAAK